MIASIQYCFLKGRQQSNSIFISKNLLFTFMKNLGFSFYAYSPKISPIMPRYVGYMSFILLTWWSFHSEELYHSWTKDTFWNDLFSFHFFFCFSGLTKWIWNFETWSFHWTYIICLGLFALFWKIAPDVVFQGLAL